jgi:uncharacterized protein YdaT
MPYSYPDDVPRPAKNWEAEAQKKCVAAANAVLADKGSEQDAIFACIRAAGKTQHPGGKGMDLKDMIVEGIAKFFGEHFAPKQEDKADVQIGKEQPTRGEVYQDEAIGAVKHKCVCAECGATSTTAKACKDVKCEKCGEAMKDAPKEAQKENAEEYQGYVEILKADKAEQKVWAVVLEPHVVDAQGDWLTVEEIAKACHAWLAGYGGAMGVGHKGGPNRDVEVIECWTAKADFQLGEQVVKEGSWLIGAHIRDAELWAKVESGEFNGFSIQGWGKRRRKSLKGA